MSTSKIDPYAEIAKRTGLSREEAKKRMHRHAYLNNHVEASVNPNPISSLDTVTMLMLIEAVVNESTTKVNTDASNIIGPDTSDIGGSSSSVSSSSSDSFSDYSSGGGSSSDW